MPTPHTGDPNEPIASQIAEATDTIRLDHGRTLAYCEFDDPSGSPALAFHDHGTNLSLPVSSAEERLTSLIGL